MSHLEQQFRIAEIDVSKISTEERLVGLFRFEHPGAVNRGPTLLCIADIHSSLYVYERLLDLLNATIEQTRRLTVTVGQDPVGRFEKIVQRINDAISDFGEKEASPLNWKRMNLFLLELTEGHLCFTGIGKLMNVLYQKQPDETFRSFDLLGAIEKPVDVDPRKPFASIVCGTISAGDVLIVGTENLERLRGELRFKERLTTLPPVTAALEIRQDLEHRSIPDHFIAAIISCQIIKMPTSEIPSTSANESLQERGAASIKKLRSTEEEAARHLAPPISPVAPKLPIWMNAFLHTIHHWVFHVLRHIRLGRWWKKQLVDPVAFASLRSMHAGYGNFFTKRKKTGLLCSIALVVALVSGILLWQHSKTVAAETTIWNATYTKATEQKNRAEASLIYGNDERARNEISAAEQILSMLPQKSANRKERIAKLTHGIQALKERLKKIVSMESTELAISAGGTEKNLAAPVLTTDAAYVVDHARQAILKVSLSTKTIKIIQLPPQNLTIVAASKGKDLILFTTAQGLLFALNKGDDSLHSFTWTHTRTSSTADIILYAGKLYSLDPAQNQVWRSTNTGGGFGGEAPYIKATSASLATAVSLAIDSNVYILQRDGTILRFLSGGQEGFSFASIEPPLRNASAMWTELESNRIAIADPIEKRIVFFDKSGALKAQVMSSQMTSPRDLDVDETNKRMLVVDGNRLLLVPTP